MKKAIAICRVSSKKQEENNHSLEQQDSSVKSMAAILEVEIVHTWSMAISSKKGKNLKRKDIIAALSMCRHDKNIKYLLIDKVSRFGRELKIIFYFKVEFEKLGVKLVFCDASQQKFNGDNAEADYELARQGYRDEAENEERASTSNTKMKARVAIGYYPFYPHQGYKKTSAADGLHVRDEPRFSLLQTAMRAIINFDMTTPEALKWLHDSGYLTPQGNKLQLDKFEQNILLKSYYAGIVEVSDWEINLNGLHEAMITVEEHETLAGIVKGRIKRKKNKYNPDFPLNLTRHTCNHIDNKMSGVNHNNGKGWKRKEYECRGCKKRIPQQYVHETLDKTLDRLKPSKNGLKELEEALGKAWNRNEAYRIERIKALKHRKGEISEVKSKLVVSMSINAQYADDFAVELDKVKVEIANIDQEIANASKIDQEYKEFVSFALNYTENLRKNWWKLPGPQVFECRKLLFNDEIFLSKEKFFYTPRISSIYTLAKQKRRSKTVQNVDLVELAGSAPASIGLR